MTSQSPDHNAQQLTFYERVCESYHAVDDFRMKLLGLLPVATGTGVFLLLSTKADAIGTSNSRLEPSLAAVGIFGLIFSLGLFTYELFGIKKCHYLIETGRRLEREMQVRGQFRARPQSVLRLMNEPFASALIYPACMAAWAFLGLAMVNGAIAAIAAGAIFLGGVLGTLIGVPRIGTTYEHEVKVLELLDGKRKTVDEIHLLLGGKCSWLDKTVRALVQRGEIVESQDVLMRVP